MAALGNPILIDGSHGEGGGALVRTCLAMACLTQQAVRIDGVRSGTKFPGLDYEDLVLMRALGRSCAAEMTGAEVGSTAISFLPTQCPRGVHGTLDLPDDEDRRRSASAPVVLNAMLPVLARTGMYSQVQMSGETYGSRSLSFDYFQNVTIPALQRFGLYAFPDQERAGFGRESRGSVTMDVEPSHLKGTDWSDRGELVGVRAIVTTAELPVTVTQRATAHLEKLAQHSKLPLEIETNPVDSRSAGAFVTVWAEFERAIGGATAMGARGVRMETLVHTAFEGMLDWYQSNATVDPFLVDQLLIAASIAEGETVLKTSRLTQRLLTCIWVVKQFLPIHITVRGTEDKPGTITIRQ